MKARAEVRDRAWRIYREHEKQHGWGSLWEFALSVTALVLATVRIGDALNGGHWVQFPVGVLLTVASVVGFLRWRRS